jgi:hypothetical protein
MAWKSRGLFPLDCVLREKQKLNQWLEKWLSMDAMKNAIPHNFADRLDQHPAI